MKNYEVAEILKEFNDEIQFDPKKAGENTYDGKIGWINYIYEKMSKAMEESNMNTADLYKSHEEFSKSCSNALNEKDIASAIDKFEYALASAGSSLADRLNIKNEELVSYNNAKNQAKELADDIQKEFERLPVWSVHDYGMFHMRDSYEKLTKSMKNIDMDTSKLENAYNDAVDMYRSESNYSKVMEADNAFMSELEKSVRDFGSMFSFEVKDMSYAVKDNSEEKTPEKMKDMINDISLTLYERPVWEGHEFAYIYLEKEYHNVSDIAEKLGIDTKDLKSSYEKVKSMEDKVPLNEIDVSDNIFFDQLDKTCSEIDKHLNPEKGIEVNEVNERAIYDSYSEKLSGYMNRSIKTNVSYEIPKLLQNIENINSYDAEWIKGNDYGFEYKDKWLKDSYENLKKAMKERNMDTSKLESAYAKYENTVSSKNSRETISLSGNEFGKQLIKSGNELADKLNIKAISDPSKTPTKDQTENMIKNMDETFKWRKTWSAKEYGIIHLKNNYIKTVDIMKSKNMDTSKLEDVYNAAINAYKGNDYEATREADNTFIDTLQKSVSDIADKMNIRTVEKVTEKMPEKTSGRKNSHDENDIVF